MKKKQIIINVSNEDYKLLCKYILFLKNINTQGKTYKSVTSEDVTGIMSSVWKQSNISQLLKDATDTTKGNGENGTK